MVVFNYSTRELTTKIVYYGPGLCGKTTNLQFIYDNMPQGVRGKMLSLATKSDRTLFFDFLPIDLGEIQGMKTKVQLYTVPGQVFYNETRRLVLKGADGVVFVADSQENMLDANLDSFNNLEENLHGHGLELARIPHVLQYNKQDLPNAMPVEQLNEKLNRYNVPFYEAVATTGVGVQETLRHITKLVLLHLNERYASGRPGEAAQPAAPVAQPAPAPTPFPEVAQAAESQPEPAIALDPPRAEAGPAYAEGMPAAPAAASMPEAPAPSPSPPVDAPAPPAESVELADFEFDTPTGVDTPAAPELPAVASAAERPETPSVSAAGTPGPSPEHEVPAMASAPEASIPPVAAPEPSFESLRGPDTGDVFGLPASLGRPAAASAADEDVLRVSAGEPAHLPAEVAGATLKIDRRDLDLGLPAAPPTVTAAPAAEPEVAVAAPATATATAVEVAPEDPLFQEQGIEPTRLVAGQPQEILVPLEIESGGETRRFRLVVRLDLAP